MTSLKVLGRVQGAAADVISLASSSPPADLTLQTGSSFFSAGDLRPPAGKHTNTQKESVCVWARGKERVRCKERPGFLLVTQETLIYVKHFSIICDSEKKILLRDTGSFLCMRMTELSWLDCWWFDTSLIFKSVFKVSSCFLPNL